MTPYETAKARVEAGDVSFEGHPRRWQTPTQHAFRQKPPNLPASDLPMTSSSDVRQALFERTRLMDAMQDERDEYRDLLKDILDLDAEGRTLGGGPGWSERREKAYAAGWERFS